MLPLRHIEVFRLSRRTSWVLFFLLISIIPSFSQNTIGIPDIINYSKDVYNAGTQNRGIVQDKNGVVYFANYEGLLSFDGTYWKIYHLPNKSVVRSITLGKDGKIYVGGQDDFGYFSPDGNGKLGYSSLKGLVPEQHNSFVDVWNSVMYGNDIFFMCREKIFQFSNRSVTVFPAIPEWLFLGLSNGQLIAQDAKNGLLAFNAGVWGPFIKENALPPEFLVTSVFPFGQDSSFVTTVNT